MQILMSKKLKYVSVKTQSR